MMSLLLEEKPTIFHLPENEATIYPLRERRAPNQKSKLMGYFLLKEANNKEKVHRQEKNETTFLLLENLISSKKIHRHPESEHEKSLPLEIEVIVISHLPEKKLTIVIFLPQGGQTNSEISLHLDEKPMMSLLLDEKPMMSLLQEEKPTIFHLPEQNQTKEMCHQEDRLLSKKNQKRNKPMASSLGRRELKLRRVEGMPSSLSFVRLILDH
jgi:hypothetical protein